MTPGREQFVIGQATDGFAMNRQHPATFHIPTRRQVKALRVGDLVKVGWPGERIWYALTSVGGTGFTGWLACVPLDDRVPELLTFQRRHILAIHRPEDV